MSIWARKLTFFRYFLLKYIKMRKQMRKAIIAYFEKMKSTPFGVL